MGKIDKTVFLSYRRKSVPWALTIFQDLSQNGRRGFRAGTAGTEPRAEPGGASSIDGEAGHPELLAAVGKVNRRSGQGSGTCGHDSGESGAGGESFGPAERGVSR